MGEGQTHQEVPPRGRQVRSGLEEAGQPFALQMEKRPPRRRSQTPLGSGKEKEKGSLLGCQATPAHGLQISDSQGNPKCTFFL